MVYKEKRLHPATIFFNFLQFLKEFALPIILGLFTLRGQALLYLILILGAIFLVILSFSVASWYRFTYRVEDEELRIEHGIFIRKKRYISINRIQSINLTQSVFHRIFKLVKVQVETAGGGEGAEVSLKAVTLQDGELLRADIKAKPESIEHSTREDVPTDYPSDKISVRRLFIAGTTSGSIGVLLAVFAFLISQAEQLIPDDFFDQSVQWIIGLSLTIIIGLGIILLLVLWLLGIAGTMIKYGNFTITKYENELFITRGLLEKKQTTIPLKRIQAVGIDESILRQPFGFAEVYVEVAGGSLEKGEDFSTVLFPILKREEIESFLGKYLPNYKAPDDRLHTLPKRGIWYYLIRSSVLFLIIGGVILYFLPQFIWITVVLLLIGLLYGFLKYKDSGYNINHKHVTVRYRRGLSRSTIRIFHNRLQAVEIKQHKVERMQALASVKLSIIGLLGSGTHYHVKEMEGKEAERLFDWYSYRKRDEANSNIYS